MMRSGIFLNIVKLLVLYTALIILATLVRQLKLTSLSPREQLPTSNISAVSPLILRSFGSADIDGRISHFLKYFVKSRREIFPLTISRDPFHIKNDHVCRKDKDVDLLVLVISAAPYFHKRRSIRRTWGNVSQYHSHRVRLVFVLGLSQKASVTADIIKENAVHNDIVQGNFIDAYHNLTHKAVMAMRWTSENCPNAKLVVKVDDDTFVNIFKILEEFDGKYRNKSKEILCKVATTGSSPIHRSPNNKWRLSGDFFPNNTCYPFPHCIGFFVMFSPDIITPVYETAKKAPFIWIDDVYLTGLLPTILGGIKLTKLDNLLLWRQSDAMQCFQSTIKRCDVRAVLTQRPIAIERLWSYALKNRSLLSNSSRTSVKATFYKAAS